MADLTPDEIARLQREHASMTVLLHEYRAGHDFTGVDGACICDTCAKTTAVIGDRAE